MFFRSGDFYGVLLTDYTLLLAAKNHEVLKG